MIESKDNSLKGFDGVEESNLMRVTWDRYLLAFFHFLMMSSDVGIVFSFFLNY